MGAKHVPQPRRLYTALAPTQITAKINDKIPMVVLNRGPTCAGRKLRACACS
jgi:hypothetical protein